MRHPIFFFAILLFCCLPGLSLANGLFFSTLTVRDGLPSNIITNVCQDQHGFIWVGTDVGLARYDGYRFKHFKKSQSVQSLPSDEINVIASSGNYLWVGTWDGLCKINTQSFAIERVDIGPSKAVRTLHKGKNGVLWIGTNNGLVRLNTLTGKFRIFDQHNSELSHNTVRSIYEDNEGNLWVGTYDGLNFLNRDELVFKRIELNPFGTNLADNHLVLDIQKAPGDDFIWVGTGVGLFKAYLNSKTATQIFAKDGFSNEVIKSIYVAPSGELWLGSDFGLNIFNPLTLSNTPYFHNPNVAYSLANNVVWQIFEDKGGVLWMVTSNGLSRCNRQGEFYQYYDISYEINGQIIGNHIRSFFVGSDSTYWLATQNGVLNVDPTGNSKTIFQNDTKINHRILLNNVYALEEDEQGRIWIGSAGGINIWDPRQGILSQINAEGEKNGLNSNYIGKFSKLEDGTLWVNAWEGGIFKIDGLESNVFRFNQIKGMESDSELHTYGNGYLWVIDNGQLYKVDTASLNSTRVDNFEEGVTNRRIYSIYFSQQGHLWAGTINGLLKYDPVADTTIYYSIKSSKDIIVSSIIEDDEGNIWSTGSAALYKFYPKKGYFEVFPLDKNLPISAFYYGCAARGPKGQIIFGGDNGYIVFDPKDAKPNTYQPPVYFTSLEINNRAINVDTPNQEASLIDTDIPFLKDLTLPYDSRSFTLEFAALHYWQPESNIYSYKLEGFDQNWHHVSDRRNFAVYSNLPAGDYRFVVKGSNNYGIESDQAAMLNITIKPPLFLSHGFIALYAFLIIAGIVYSHRTYYGRVNLKNELKIARIEKEHTEEIERTKERFFTNISHELRTPISLILPPILEIQNRGGMDECSRNLIKLAEKNSVRLLRLVNQILDFNKLGVDGLQLKVSEVEMVGYCKEIFSLFEDQANRNEIDFVLKSEVEQQAVWIDAEKIETVLFNLLSNAFKFTPPRRLYGSMSFAAKGPHRIQRRCLPNYCERLWYRYSQRGSEEDF